MTSYLKYICLANITCTIEEYEKALQNIYKISNITKYRDFQFSNCAIYTYDRLFHWKKVASQKCNYCNEKQTVKHSSMFWDTCTGVSLLPPATMLRQGNIFTGVCQSFCLQKGGGGGGFSVPVCTTGHMTGCFCPLDFTWYPHLCIGLDH